LRHLDPSQKTTIHILSQTFSQQSLGILQGLIDTSGKPVDCEIRPIELDCFEKINTRNLKELAQELPLETYGRLLIPSLFPDINFGVYLDSDVLVQKDLSQVFQYRSDQHPIWVVDDMTITSLSHPDEFLDCEALGVDPDAPYFNTGVMVFNLNLWERDTLLEKCQEIGSKSKLRWADQSLLNVIFTGRWQKLESSWNNMITPEYREYAFPKPDNNYHCVGGSKPWHFPATMTMGVLSQCQDILREAARYGTIPSHVKRKPYLIFFLKTLLTGKMR
ncbi:MAG: hypothetical protein KJT03_17295, partial [Verrucomicrobiae bacterium]|nr:hypothetical protein [Verrucomicrobiae bacterium]